MFKKSNMRPYQRCWPTETVLMESIKNYKITLDNDVQVASETAEFLAEQARILCRFSERQEFHVFVSLVEAINNAIVHGNLEVDSKLRLEGVNYEQTIEARRHTPPFKDRIVIVTANYSKDQVTYTIENEGPGFDVSKIPVPTAEENLTKPSGRGVLIMRSFFDSVEFNDTGTCLKMIKKVLHPVRNLPNLQQVESP